MKSIAVIEGGSGAEAIISKKTSKAFQKALDQLGYKYQVFEANKNLPEELSQFNPDVALLAVHGQYCEDGILQGLLEYLKIPYTGSGVLASSLCFNKDDCKKMLSLIDIPMAKSQICILGEKNNLSDILFSFPWFIKPAREGSSFGAHKVKSLQEAEVALRDTFKYDSEALIEQFIEGVEITVSVSRGEVFPTVEIEPLSGLYDFESKYTKGKSKYHMPPRISQVALQQAEANTLKIFNFLKLRSMARVDYIVKNDKAYFLEVNTLPGCTETSLLPMAAKKMGFEFTDVIQKLIDSAALDYDQGKE